MAIVQLFDIDEKLVSDWAMTHCASFQGWLIYENSDAFGFASFDDTVDWMVRYEFEFRDNSEAMLFQLRWQGQ